MIGVQCISLGDEMALLLLVSSEEATSCCLTDYVCCNDCNVVI